MAELLRDVLPQGREIHKAELTLVPGEGSLAVGRIAAEGFGVEVMPPHGAEDHEDGIGDPADHMPPGYLNQPWTTFDDINLKAGTGKTRQKDYWIY